MTTPNHIVQGGLIGYYLTGNIYVSIIAGLLSGLPDLSGWMQGIIKPELRWTGLYNWFHNIRNTWYIPFINLHSLEDYFLHYKTGGIVKLRYKVAEITTWLIMAFLIYGITT